jgi:hypothetical protein
LDRETEDHQRPQALKSHLLLLMVTLQRVGDSCYRRQSKPAAQWFDESLIQQGLRRWV